MWHGEALYGLGVQDVGVLLLLGGFFSVKSGSYILARFLIYGVHAVHFLPLVTILDLSLFVFRPTWNSLHRSGWPHDPPPLIF
jgi:hypothetical protein